VGQFRSVEYNFLYKYVNYRGVSLGVSNLIFCINMEIRGVNLGVTN